MEATAERPLCPRATVEEGIERQVAPAASDAELVARINEGDESAFEELYRRHRDWVVQLAYRWTGDREAALDVLQETFIYFSRKFPGFTLSAKLQTFLYPAVRNLSIAARRKRERYQSDALHEKEVAELAVPAEPVDSTSDLLKAVLAGLSEEHREVLLLRFVDGLSLAEVAHALEIPLGTVKSRLHHSLQTLRADPRTRNLFDE